MNLDELKTEWKRYDARLAQAQRLNEQLVTSMIRERSRSRVSQIRRNNALFIALMLVNLLFLTAVFAGNPFDFNYALQYVPFGCLAIGNVLALLSLIESFRNFMVDINHVNLEKFLQKIILEYEKNKKLERWFGIIILSAGLASAFSFLPHKLAHKALWPALGETAVSIALSLVVYFIAFKLGAFKSRKAEFENDLKEWQELKTIASDLNDR